MLTPATSHAGLPDSRFTHMRGLASDSEAHDISAMQEPIFPVFSPPFSLQGNEGDAYAPTDTPRAVVSDKTGLQPRWRHPNHVGYCPSSVAPMSCHPFWNASNSAGLIRVSADDRKSHGPQIRDPGVY